MSMLIFREDGSCVSASTKLLELLGYSPGDAQSLHTEITMDGQIWNQVRSRLEMATSEEEESAFCLRKKNGETLVVQASVCLIEDTGNDVYYYALLVQEPTVPPNIHLLRQFSDSFVKSANLGVLLLNDAFKLVDISPIACQVLGLERRTALNQPMDALFAAVPEEYQLISRSLLEGVVVRNHAVAWTNAETRYELLLDASLLYDETGKRIGAYVIFKDVTNLRSLEEQVQRSDRLSMIGQIAAGTAHEIRNPLTSIKGFLQVLKKTLQGHGLRREYEYTQIMLNEIDRINNLVSEFLLLSKPKDNKYTSVDISSVIRDILPIINNEAILHNVVVQYEAEEELPLVVADRELLKQVYINVSKNGIEAMTEGGTLTIRERLDEANQFIHVDIHDTGPGIPSYVIDKIFDPFFTTKENGTGLGLAVCQRIIHDAGGQLRVSSKGFGTTFTISIPYAGTS
ncbi:PAS domain-containing sensor histidine kinase [Xylanibacillus composti]|uniref:histidine kinase n=1 Tax=Xylanibacillus composti TaxID=1572762 RepID=A0A8J4H5Q4_9BACL|nr:ATP-binding protein [Xylanibacillus composti]GIQ71324.1 PAS domain-containing sensor histidine kinase [Xylanibacillus composti]